MSRKYDEYLEHHIQGVFKSYEWLRNNVPDLFVDSNLKLKCDYLISIELGYIIYIKTNIIGNIGY